MNVGTLKEFIEEIPDDYEVELSKFIVLDDKEEGPFEMFYDVPICGVAKHEEAKHLRFMIESNEKTLKSLKEYGEIKRL